MADFYLILRSIPFFLAAFSSMFSINDWLSVMLGPDCWDYSPKELGISKPGERYGSYGTSGQRYGVDPSQLNEPVVQSLRYAVSGVGVHILFIALMMIYFGVSSKFSWRAPLSMILLDLLTLGNATGLFHAATAGHPRCVDPSVSLVDCAKGLSAFGPVVVIDFVALAVAAWRTPKRSMGEKQE